MTERKPPRAILLVEDDQYKAEQISSLICSIIDKCNLRVAHSVSAAKNSLREGRFDLIVLDMSLPSYDIDNSEAGGFPQPFGGRELLGYLDFLDIAVPTIVITQYDIIASETERTDLESLGESFSRQYSRQFRKIIFYSTTSEAWRAELSVSIREIL